MRKFVSQWIRRWSGSEDTSLLAYQATANGSWGGGYGVRALLAGSSYDYRREAGLVYDNSVVASCIDFLANKFSEANLEIQVKDENGKWIRDPRVQFETDPFLTPNEYYGEDAIWYGIVLSLFVAGRAILYKVRNQYTGKIDGFYYLPHFQCRVMSNFDNADGRKLITHVEYTPLGGSPQRLDLEDVVLLRWGIDPLNPGTGISPLGAVLREICTDNEASTYSAALLRNMGIPGAVVMPDDGATSEPTADQREAMASRWKEFLRDARGGILALPRKMKIEYPAFDPQKMVLRELRSDNSSRICSAFKIAPVVIGLGDDKDRTYNNYPTALRASLENAFLPVARMIATQLTHQLKGDFDLDINSRRFGWDLDEVLGLQEGQDELHKRVREDYKAGIIDRYTAKERIGEAPEDIDRGVYATRQPQNQQTNPENENENTRTTES
jgi:HK97 family phage portal protein